jgi:predicted DsbA family dithiol-disulfide isomerase
MSDVNEGAVCGVDGCTDADAPAAAIPQGPALELSIVSDAICPWCYIGKRRLEKALAALDAPEKFRIVWRPFELNPDMPKEGIERHLYRARKFGSLERSNQLDAQVKQAAAGEGLDFRYDLMTRTPNTFDAHRLMWAAAAGPRQDALMEAIFRAYFCEGRDIRRADVLAELAPHGGIDSARARALLAGEEGKAEVARDLSIARRAGISGVPSFIAGGRLLFSGAQPPDVIAAVLRQILAPAANVAFGPA